MSLTCRDDADAKGAGRQSFLRTVWVHAAVHLRPPDQAVDDLAEHAIPSDTHHPERESQRNHQSPGGRRRARWKKLAQKSILRELNLRFVFLLFWCFMCHPGGFYLTAKFCPAKGSVLVIWRPLWSSSVADKNRNLQQELFCNLKVSGLSEKRNKMIKASSFFNSGETEKWIVHLRVSCQLNWFPAVLLLWKATRWFDALTHQASSAPPLSSGDLWRGWRTRWLQRTTGTLQCVHTFFFFIQLNHFNNWFTRHDKKCATIFIFIE